MNHNSAIPGVVVERDEVVVESKIFNVYINVIGWSVYYSKVHEVALFKQGELNLCIQIQFVNLLLLFVLMWYIFRISCEI